MLLTGAISPVNPNFPLRPAHPLPRRGRGFYLSAASSVNRPPALPCSRLAPPSGLGVRPAFGRGAASTSPPPPASTTLCCLPCRAVSQAPFGRGAASTSAPRSESTAHPRESISASPASAPGGARLLPAAAFCRQSGLEAFCISTRDISHPALLPMEQLPHLPATVRQDPSDCCSYWSSQRPSRVTSAYGRHDSGPSTSCSALSRMESPPQLVRSLLIQ